MDITKSERIPLVEIEQKCRKIICIGIDNVPSMFIALTHFGMFCSDVNDGK